MLAWVGAPAGPPASATAYIYKFHTLKDSTVPAERVAARGPECQSWGGEAASTQVTRRTLRGVALEERLNEAVWVASAPLAVAPGCSGL